MGGISEENVAENTANETETQPTQSTNPESKPEETKIEAPVKILPLYVTAIDRVSFERTANDQNLLQAVVLFGITCDAKVDPSTLVAQIQYRLPYGPQQSAVRLVDVDLGVREIQNPKSEQLVRQQFCVCVPLDDPNLKNLPPQPVVHYTILLKGTTDPKSNSLQSVPILSSESPQRPPFNTFKVQFKLTNNNNPNQTSSDAFPTTVKDLITTCDRAADSVATEVENVLQSAAKVFDKLPGIASSWLNRFEKFMDEVDKDLKGNNTTSNTQPVNPSPSNVNTQPTFVPIQPQPLNPYGQYYQPGAKPAERPTPVQTQSEPPKQQDQAAQNDVNQNSAFSISD